MSTDPPLAGPPGPASPPPDKMPANRRRAAQFFGTRLRSMPHGGGGRWAPTDADERYEIGRHRAEPGYPAAWWCFGPGGRDGTWPGGNADEAPALATHHTPDFASRWARP